MNLADNFIYTEDWEEYNGGIDPSIPIAVWEQGRSVVLPSHYRGKNFKAFASLVTYWDLAYDNDPDYYIYGSPAVECRVNTVQVGDPTTGVDAIIYVRAYWKATGRELFGSDWQNFSWYNGLQFLLTVII